MSTITQDRSKLISSRAAEVLLHLYDHTPVQVGDVALCGHIRRSAASVATGADKCVVCLDLARERPRDPMRVTARRRTDGTWELG